MHHWIMSSSTEQGGSTGVTCEGARHNPRKLTMVIALDMLPVVEKVVDGLHIEALLDFGEGSGNDM